jgi:hypothetical protein
MSNININTGTKLYYNRTFNLVFRFTDRVYINKNNVEFNGTNKNFYCGVYYSNKEFSNLIKFTDTSLPSSIYNFLSNRDVYDANIDVTSNKGQARLIIYDSSLNPQYISGLINFNTGNIWQELSLTKILELDFNLQLINSNSNIVNNNIQYVQQLTNNNHNINIKKITTIINLNGVKISYQEVTSYSNTNSFVPRTDGNYNINVTMTDDLNRRKTRDLSFNVSPQIQIPSVSPRPLNYTISNFSLSPSEISLNPNSEKEENINFTVNIQGNDNDISNNLIFSIKKPNVNDFTQIYDLSFNNLVTEITDNINYKFDSSGIYLFKARIQNNTTSAEKITQIAVDYDPLNISNINLFKNDNTKIDKLFLNTDNDIILQYDIIGGKTPYDIKIKINNDVNNSYLVNQTSSFIDIHTHEFTYNPTNMTDNVFNINITDANNNSVDLNKHFIIAYKPLTITDINYNIPTTVNFYKEPITFSTIIDGGKSPYNYELLYNTNSNNVFVDGSNNSLTTYKLQYIHQDFQPFDGTFIIKATDAINNSVSRSINSKFTIQPRKFELKEMYASDFNNNRINEIYLQEYNDYRLNFDWSGNNYGFPPYAYKLLSSTDNKSFTTIHDISGLNTLPIFFDISQNYIEYIEQDVKRVLFYRAEFTDDQTGLQNNKIIKSINLPILLRNNEQKKIDDTIDFISKKIRVSKNRLFHKKNINNSRIDILNKSDFTLSNNNSFGASTGTGTGTDIAIIQDIIDLTNTVSDITLTNSSQGVNMATNIEPVLPDLYSRFKSLKISKIIINYEKITIIPSIIQNYFKEVDEYKKQNSNNNNILGNQ